MRVVSLDRQYLTYFILFNNTGCPPPGKTDMLLQVSVTVAILKIIAEESVFLIVAMFFMATFPFLSATMFPPQNSWGQSICHHNLKYPNNPPVVINNDSTQD